MKKWTPVRELQTGQIKATYTCLPSVVVGRQD